MLMQDIRHAFRLFFRTPIVTATAVLTIALGVGGSTAVFSIVYAVMLRPLPYPAPDRLVELFEDNPRADRPMFRVSTLNYLSWAERATSMEALATFQGSAVTLTDNGDPERLPGSAITASMFRVLGLPLLAGRGFRAEDERPGAQRVAVLGETLWRRRFGGDAAIVGQSITLNGERHQVVGVVPGAFREVGRTQASSVEAAQIFVPLTIDPAHENRGNHVMRVVGRLRPGVSLDLARDEMRRIAGAMEQEFPATNKDWGVRLVTLYDSMLDERVRPSLLVLLAAVGMVLLIACANVANMLLARGISRQRELALTYGAGGRTLAPPAPARHRECQPRGRQRRVRSRAGGPCRADAAGHAAAHADASQRDRRRRDGTRARPAPVDRERLLHGVGAGRARVARSPWCLHSRSRARGSPVPRERCCATPSSWRRWPLPRCCSWVRRCCCRVSSGCSRSASGSNRKA